MTGKKSKTFDWKTGSILSSEDTEPLGQVREVGFSKISNAVLADPELRKEARKKLVSRPSLLESEDFLSESSVSGLSREISESAAKKLFESPKSDLKGLKRFQSSIASSKKDK